MLSFRRISETDLTSVIVLMCCLLNLISSGVCVWFVEQSLISLKGFGLIRPLGVFQTDRHRETAALVCESADESFQNEVYSFGED